MVETGHPICPLGALHLYNGISPRDDPAALGHRLLERRTFPPVARRLLRTFGP